jgi:hypothetical protein
MLHLSPSPAGHVDGAPVEPTAAFAQRPLDCVDQIPWRDEVMRPLVLLADRPATPRAPDTHTPPETVRPCTRRFRQPGMRGRLPGDVEVMPGSGPARALRRCRRRWIG